MAHIGVEDKSFIHDIHSLLKSKRLQMSTSFVSEGLKSDFDAVRYILRYAALLLVGDW